MRQVSTLNQDQRFRLDKQEMMVGFVGFYRERYKAGNLKPLDFLWQLYAMLLMPNLSGKILNSKELTKNLKEWTSAEARGAIHTKSALFKINAQKKFVVQATLMGVTKTQIGNILPWILDAYQQSDPSVNQAFKDAVFGGLTPDQFAARQSWDTVFTGDQIAARLNCSQRAREIFRTAIENASLVDVAGKLCLTIRFNISFKEAEYLGQTEVADIKNGNFYSFLFPWIASNLATDTGSDVAPYSVPMTKIAAQVKAAAADPSAKVTKRSDGDNLLVTHIGDYLFIPDIDNTDRYEQELMTFGQRSDGSFSYDQATGPTEGPQNYQVNVNDPNNPRKKLPANMPLFTDWVNRKFAFVNSSGNVDTLDLGNCTPLSAFHVKKLLDTLVHANDQTTKLGYALFLAEQTQPGFLKSETPLASEMDPRLWNQLKDKTTQPNFLNTLPDAVYRFRNANRITHSDLVMIHPERPGGISTPLRAFGAESSVTEFRFVGRLVERAHKLILDNLEVIFRRYSVTTVLSAIAVLQVFNKYSGQYEIVETRDRNDREAYIDQGIDPDYTPEALPNFKKGAMFMPHQAKANNKLRRGPKFAIIEVDAGGGKTLQILTNILKEVKDKRCVRPIIACPPHLVSSYIKEAVYFTEGKINIIPLTNISMKQHGEERLASLISKAPVNTIFLTDFDFVKNRGTEVAYGNKMITVYKNAEFLRRFEFDLICVDECHYLRSPSLRTRAMQSFMTEIPMKRLASGTFIADTVADVAPQFSLLDPTVFGTRDQFMAEYSSEMKGNKVVSWKPGAEAKIRQKMSDHCVMIKHKRREWAALLPEPVEEFFGVELTDNQRALYESILNATMEMLREAIAKDPELREALESNDDTKVEELQFKLHRYLARLEAFLSCPETDEAGKDFLLLPEDKVSPKVRKIYDRIRHHSEAQIPGKILIFTNYIRAAESVFENAPPDLKKRMILYTAENKMECKAAFENQPEKDIMVGVETSMNTGLNFQFVSRLIRMETVWTPGVLEQGNARVNRPNKKVAERREKIYFDWIVINRTIDVTKISRLVSKMVSKAKFDEWDNPAYQEIPSVPQVAMTMDTIAAHNDFEGSLLPYLESYESYKQIQHADYKAYKEANQEGDVPIPAEGLLPGSKLMTRVPYIPDMEIYGENELGLIRYDQFIHEDVVPTDDDDDEAEDNENDAEEDAVDPKYARLLEERSVMKGQPVHTEWGDGVVTGLGKKRVRVLFGDGTRKAIRKLSVYVITRSSTNSKDMRAELLKGVGDIPLTEPFDVPVEEGPANKKRTKPDLKPVIEKMETRTAEFDITIINDYLALSYRSGGSGDKIAGQLVNLGFVRSPDYYYSRLIGPQNLKKLFTEWAEAGFKVDKKTSAIFQHVHLALKGDKKAATHYGWATSIDLRNWLRSTVKPTSDPMEIHPYPIAQDDKLFIALPLHGQPGTRQAIKHHPMNIRWKLGGGEGEILRFVTSPKEIIDVLKKVKDEGIEISNLDEIKEQYENVKMVRPRKD